MAQLHLLVLAVSPSCLYEGKVSGAVSSSFRFGDAPNPPFPCREGLGAQEVLSIFPLVAGGEVADRVLFRCSVSKKETHQVRTWGGHGELQKAASSSVLFLPHPPPVHFPKRAVIQHGCGAVCPPLVSRARWRGGQGCWEPGGFRMLCFWDCCSAVPLMHKQGAASTTVAWSEDV